MAERLALFATTARGTEDLLAEELRELGARRIRQDRGGVRFLATLYEALQVCLWSRIAMRVLYPLGEFEARGAEGLYDAAASVPWEEHLTPDHTFAVEATLRDSEHSHSGFVALKVKDALVDRLRRVLGARPDVDTREPDVRVVAHLAREKLSLSLDLCGEPLNRRGYRVRPTPAPLKETLAAALLRAANYTGEEALVDPMCGSGTLLIEAGFIARHRAPGIGRSFAVERWPHQGARAKELLEDLRADARRNERKVLVPIQGFDKDPEALEAARRNIKAARLSEEIQVAEGDATKPLPLPKPGGLLITNPPYGERIGTGGQKGMKSFYFKLGESFQELDGWRAHILSGNPAFESAFHARPSSRREVWNGPIECELLGYRFGFRGGPGAENRSEPALGPANQARDVLPVRPEHEDEEEP
ncbi:THUMP domain-containing class I SAM-dependent RNA methyltransferase [Stigmatella aurantiaca]|uniref:N6-adenine-specific DNA methylase n=1 Tax=Stigmatella aurantiaca (strain DW4/3-1) TaxID=378806 RepID=Q09CQ7_STIAD|nr:THUMP domain-containing protein [Stigmatella aurantiaca]ADO70064.1 THUMP domain/methyltransferase domain protein [Stigmatella aurantiaca DW4/3-1]EAU69462.1 N6-adenine-specific DNA methylase [Stigmatella aurantiaca DW4/3-1]